MQIFISKPKPTQQSFLYLLDLLEDNTKQAQAQVRNWLDVAYEKLEQEFFRNHGFWVLYNQISTIYITNVWLEKKPKLLHKAMAVIQRDRLAAMLEYKRTAYIAED